MLEKKKIIGKNTGVGAGRNAGKNSKVIAILSKDSSGCQSPNSKDQPLWLERSELEESSKNKK